MEVGPGNNSIKSPNSICSKNGNIVSHEGTWHAGVDGANAGIVMPGVVLNGGRYYQEVAPGVAMDRAEIISANWTVETLAGAFKHCLKT
jgi:hypothetical protein